MVTPINQWHSTALHHALLYCSEASDYGIQDVVHRHPLHRRYPVHASKYAPQLDRNAYRIQRTISLRPSI